MKSVLLRYWSPENVWTSISIGISTISVLLKPVEGCEEVSLNQHNRTRWSCYLQLLFAVFMFESNRQKTWLQWPKTWAGLNFFCCSCGFIKCKLLWKQLSQKTRVPSWKRMVTIVFLNILLQRGRCTLYRDIKTQKLPWRVACSMYTNVLIHTSPLSSYLVNKETCGVGPSCSLMRQFNRLTRSRLRR